MTDQATEGAYLSRVRKDVVRGSLWTFLATVLGSPIGLAANVLVSRSLGSDGLGRLATYTAIYGVAVVATNMGFSEATVQWLASATARGMDAERHELIRRCAGFHAFVSGPALAGCTIALLAGSGALLAGLGAGAVWLMQALGTSSVVNTASARNAIAAQIHLIATTAGRAAMVTAALASHHAATTWLIQLAFLGIGPLLAVFRLETKERQALFRPKLVLRAPHGFWTYAFSACVGGLVASLVFGRSEILVLRADSLLADAGIFTVITGLAGQLTAPLDALLAPLTPTAAGLISIDRARALSAFQRSLRLTAILGTIATCAFVPLLVVLIEPLYGHAFSSAAAPFAVLGLVSCLQTVLGPLSAFAFATRSAAQVLRINLLCLAADAAVAIALVPVLGIWGAVAANGIAQVVSLVWMTALVVGRLKLRHRDVMRAAALFAIGLPLGAVEVSACLALRGVTMLAAGAIIGAGVLIARQFLRHFRLGLTKSDTALITGNGSSRKLSIVVRAIQVAGLAD